MIATFSENAARSVARDYGVDPDRVRVGLLFQTTVFAMPTPRSRSASPSWTRWRAAIGARGRAHVFAGALWNHVAERLERALALAFSSRGRAA